MSSSTATTNQDNSTDGIPENYSDDSFESDEYYEDDFEDQDEVAPSQAQVPRADAGALISWLHRAGKPRPEQALSGRAAIHSPHVAAILERLRSRPWVPKDPTRVPSSWAGGCAPSSRLPAALGVTTVVSAPEAVMAKLRSRNTRERIRKFQPSEARQHKVPTTVAQGAAAAAALQRLRRRHAHHSVEQAERRGALAPYFMGDSLSLLGEMLETQRLALEGKGGGHIGHRGMMRDPVGAIAHVPEDAAGHPWVAASRVDDRDGGSRGGAKMMVTGHVGGETSMLALMGSYQHPCGGDPCFAAHAEHEGGVPTLEWRTGRKGDGDKRSTGASVAALHGLGTYDAVQNMVGPGAITDENACCPLSAGLVSLTQLVVNMKVTADAVVEGMVEPALGRIDDLNALIEQVKTGMSLVKADRQGDRTLRLVTLPTGPETADSANGTQLHQLGMEFIGDSILEECRMLRNEAGAVLGLSL
eukprot:jgi/Mesvir1/2677/Mv08124-RA.1